METTNGQTSFVRGYHHNMTFHNGFRVYGWTPNKVTRKEAIKELLDIANKGSFKCEYDENGKWICAYDKDVIENYWTTNSDTR